MAAHFIEAVRNDGTGYAHISEFQPKPGVGLGCDCHCPECGATVGARIFKSSPESSCFFHEADETNRSCHGGGPETEIHLLAKKIFEKHSHLFLRAPDNDEKPIKFKYSSVAFEKSIGSFRPDVVLRNDVGEELIVEIAVTHKTYSNASKMQLLANLGTPAVEITLERNLISKLIINAGIPLDFAVFEKFYKSILIDEIKKKEWLVKPNANLFLEQVADNSKQEYTDFGIVIVVIVLLIVGYCIYKIFKK